MLSIRRLYAYWRIALHCRLPHSLLAAYMPLLWLAEDYTCPRELDKSGLTCPKPASSEASYVVLLEDLSHGLRLHWPPSLSNPPIEQIPSSS